MNRIISAALVAALVIAGNFSPAAAGMCGDINDSGQVTALDALGVLKAAVNQPVDVNCGPVGSLLTTGQTFCTSGTGDSVEDCEETGQDGEFQRGAPRSFKDNGNGTITDRGTGLMWERFSGDDGIHGEETTFTFAQAAVKIATLNATSFAGYNDWRLPNVNEIHSLANLGTSYYATFDVFDVNCSEGCTLDQCSCVPRYTWSSTTNNANRTQAYIIDWYDAEVFANSKTLSYSVRAVRGGYVIPDEPMFVHDGGAASPPVPPEDRSCADVNESDSITASDSLAVLKKAVGQDIELRCALLRPVLRTGQNSCYDTTGMTIPCLGTGQDAELKIGTPRLFMNNGDGTITDYRTGLQWEVLGLDGSIHDGSAQYTWAGALDNKIATLNLANFAGHDDWRMPNMFELFTIIDFGEATPETYDVFNNLCEPDCSPLTCSCTPLDTVWSSTSHHYVKANAWHADFSNGETPWSVKTGTAPVRAVRGGW